MFWTDTLKMLTKSANILVLEHQKQTFVDLVFFLFCFYTVGSLHRVFYFENWPDALCLSCVSDFLPAPSGLCSLLQLPSKINQAAGSQSSLAQLDFTVRRSWSWPLVICNTLTCYLWMESDGRLTRGMLFGNFANKGVGIPACVFKFIKKENNLSLWVKKSTWHVFDTLQH